MFQGTILSFVADHAQYSKDIVLRNGETARSKKKKKTSKPLAFRTQKQLTQP